MGGRMVELDQPIVGPSTTIETVAKGKLQLLWLKGRETLRQGHTLQRVIHSIKHQAHNAIHTRRSI
jgi:hypothetical protein